MWWVTVSILNLQIWKVFQRAPSHGKAKTFAWLSLTFITYWRVVLRKFSSNFIVMIFLPSTYHKFSSKLICHVGDIHALHIVKQIETKCESNNCSESIRLAITSKFCLRNNNCVFSKNLKYVTFCPTEWRLMAICPAGKWLVAVIVCPKNSLQAITILMSKIDHMLASKVVLWSFDKLPKRLVLNTTSL